MNNLTTTALARLRAADPAVTRPDPYGPEARTMLARILAAQDAHPQVRSRHVGRRRLAIGLAGAAAAAAATALVVAEPWSTGEPASAYTVDRHADGSVAVTIRPTQLRNPAELNAALARAGARTVAMAMVPADRCTTPPDIDPAFQLPADPTPEQVADQLARSPITYELRDDGVRMVIKPWQIPAADTLVVGYAISTNREGRTTLVRPVVVVTAPSCLGAPAPGTRPTPHR
ncbi:hypothetical protein [Micromonospora sp. NPDC005806]|uniref:hypothetical protein n=1 Tax=Micromonospora sp. NPDC005806 TaxID=3364234 RepID=UPI0036D07643